MKYEERESAQRPLIQLENLVKVYDTGALKVFGIKEDQPDDSPGRICGCHGTFRFRKVHADEYFRLPGPAYPGTLLSGWSGYGGHDAGSAL